MASATLSATRRTDTGKGAARALRRSGRVPAVIYGHARAVQSLSVATRDIDKLLSQISAASTVVELDVEGTMSRTLIREIQRHPFKRVILHVDFQELVAGEKVIVNVPLVFIGIPEGVRVGGGILDQVMHELEIEVDPANMPNHLDVDVTNVGIGHSLHVSDLTLPPGVRALAEEGATLCVVSAPKAVVEPVAAEAVEAVEAVAAEPELIRKKKADEDEEAK